jgi:two-component system sensor histidine kinase BarA
VVESAASGEEALQRLQTEPFDFVLMDLYMPGMGGVEAARQIRATTSAAALPIVACSATVTAEEVARCEQVGMQGVVPKPVDARQLVTALVALRAPVAHQRSG